MSAINSNIHGQAPGENVHRLFYAVFRQSLAVAAVSALDRSIFLAKHSGKFPVAVPGELRRPHLLDPRNA
jgi:hypothetical protein